MKHDMRFDGHKPIILCKGETKAGYGVFASFGIQLRKAFETLGQNVIYLESPAEEIMQYADGEYRAIIGFEDIIFHNVDPGGAEPLFNRFHGPKLNYWFDHPVWFYPYMKNIPENYHVMTIDRNYVAFIQKYYSEMGAEFIPLGGKIPDHIIPFSQREYDLSFVGTYEDWHACLKPFEQTDEMTQEIVGRFLEVLADHTELTTEDAFSRVLTDVGAHMSDESYIRLLYQVRPLADKGVAKLFREKIIRTILLSGYDLHVFGDSWNQSPFAKMTNLHIHPAADAEQTSEIYANSRISLNVMTWHKDGCTERIADAMMAGSIVLSDQTRYLNETFQDEKNILLFDLEHLERIPELIRKHLGDEGLAERGRKFAEENLSWRVCAERILTLADANKECI